MATPVPPLRVFLRGYQSRILDTLLQYNTIVLLPTGAGKTFIAAECVARRGGPAVFFVPTIPLVSQQAAALRSRPDMPLVGEYHGDISLPDEFQVLVTTPKAFETAQARGDLASLQWNQFNTVIFDECHHVIKDHPYRNLAFKLKLSGHRPRVVGLTASLTYSVGAAQIRKSIQRICNELDIEKIENATDEELRADGYLGAGRASVAEVRLPEPTFDPYIVPQRQRKPHLMHETFFQRVEGGGATKFGIALVRLIRGLEEEAAYCTTNFKSPLESVSLKSWGAYARKKADEHLCFASLEHWYEALRILIVSWEEGSDAVIAFLEMMDQHRSLPCWSSRSRRRIEDFFWTHRPERFVRFENLYCALEEQVRERPHFRGIVFVKQRVMVHILHHVVKNETRLTDSIYPCCLYSAKAPATASLSICKREAKEALEDFAAGFCNLLITTNVAEEGLDIPSANCVIYFDPMDHAVSYVQGRGRARQADSSFIMLNERNDRPASLLAQQEAEQHALASTFAPEKTKSQIEASRASQKQREEGAFKYLAGRTMETALANLNIYCKKTKVTLLEEFNMDGSQCKMIYKSILRDVSVHGSGNSKKAARRSAATAMLSELARCTTANVCV